jgi:hypothetical protein
MQVDVVGVGGIWAGRLLVSARPDFPNFERFYVPVAFSLTGVSRPYDPNFGASA